MGAGVPGMGSEATGLDILSSALNIALAASQSDSITSLGSVTSAGSPGILNSSVSPLLTMPSSSEAAPLMLAQPAASQSPQPSTSATADPAEDSVAPPTSTPQEAKQVTSSAHPVVLGPNQPSSVNRAMQQILDYFYKHNKSQSSSYESSIDSEARSPASTANARTDDGATTSSTPSVSIPCVRGKNNSIVLIFGKDAVKASGIQQSSTSSSSAEVNLQEGQPVLQQLLRVASIKDEVDGAAAAALPSSSAVSGGSSVDLVSPNIPATASCFQVVREVSLPAEGTSSACDTENQSSGVPSPLQESSSNADKESGQKRLRKFVPLTVSVEKDKDPYQPIFIYVVLEDGLTKQININTSPEASRPSQKTIAPKPTPPSPGRFIENFLGNRTCNCFRPAKTNISYHSYCICCYTG
jgi:hypothetical protein